MKIVPNVLNVRGLESQQRCGVVQTCLVYDRRTLIAKILECVHVEHGPQNRVESAAKPTLITLLVNEIHEDKRRVLPPPSV
jgi:hypothetical protein